MRATIGMLILMLACGGSDSTGVNPPPPPPPPGPPPPPSPAVTVRVQNNSYSPSDARVTVGGTVTWEWDGSGHSVTSVSTPGFQGAPVSNAGFTLGPLTFNTAGTYKYYCTVHGQTSGGNVSGMSGQVVVGN